MNPLPRFLAMALFVVLAALVALLAAPAWRVRTNPPPPAERPVATSQPNMGASPARVFALTQRLALVLALIGAALALALIINLAMRSGQSGASRTPFATTRTEVGALAQLAATSAAQGAELSRERNVRRRAEEDVELKQQLLSQSLEEKIRLGHDLHDGIIQSLYAVGLTLESIRTLVHSDPAEAERRLEQTRAGLNTTIRDVRAYITGLAPENLRRAGFGHAVRALLGELGASHEAKFDIQIDDDAAALLTADQSLEALQIAREAVSNALRHGSASRITLRMHKSDREVCLLVQDNGSGFDAANRRDGGHGLGNMQARAGRIGATVRVTSHPGEGSRVITTLPIAQSAAV
ncbi:MAG TPA: sensor histidine kinase [Opitutaceae bacterium]|nr:sensor histidine kinase [Opitutaceae bacterium]